MRTLLAEVDLKCHAPNLVPRGRDPFAQRRGSGPLARWDFESANRGLPVTLRRIMSKTQDGGKKWSRYVSGGSEIWIRKSGKSKYYTQTETRRDPQNNRFDAKRCFSRSPNWLRKIVNSGALAREARSGAPWVKKCGKLPIRENLVIT